MQVFYLAEGMYLDLQSGPTYQLQEAIYWTGHHLGAVLVECNTNQHIKCH